LITSAKKGAGARGAGHNSLAGTENLILAPTQIDRPEGEQVGCSSGIWPVGQKIGPRGMARRRALAINCAPGLHQVSSPWVIYWRR